MMSLLFNKKTAILFFIVLSLFLSNYAKAGADLCMESVSIVDRHEDDIYLPGESFKLILFVTNVGDEYSDNFTIDCYIGEIRIGHYNQSWTHYAPGRTEHYTMSLNIPNDIPPDNYTLWAKLTCSNDSNSDNDSNSISPDIIVPLAVDLKMQNVKAVSIWSNNIFNQGGEIRFGFTVDNRLNANSNSYEVHFSIGSYYIGSVSCNPLEAGETNIIEETSSFSIPLDIPDGYYDVWGEVVYQDDCDTSNNKVKSSSKIRVVTPHPDIAITEVITTGNNFKQGNTIFIFSTLKSLGTCEAKNINVEFYANEYLIGNISRSDLGAEQEETFVTECIFPEDLPDGNYSITVKVTCTEDSNVNNNIMNSGISFWMGKRFDLEVKSIQAANGTFMPKDTFEVYSLVNNVGDKVSNAYTIDFYMSTDKNITAMDYRIGRIERKGLEPGAQHSYNTTFKLPPNLPVGNYYIGVIVRCVEEGNFENNSGLDNETVGIIHPANYVCGHITYEYTGQNNQAVRYALLKIIDAGTDRVIAQTYTDENGNYGEVVLRDEMSTGNVYVKVYAESVIGAYPGTRSKICSVRSDADKHLYSRQSPNYSHTTNSSRIIDYTIPKEVRTIMVFDSIVEAFIQAKEYFGIEMEPITAYWPSNDDGTYYYPGEGIFISYDDEWDRDIILHEYGHYIAEAYDFCQGSVGENPNHGWDVNLREYPVQRTAEHAANLAFRESWPTLFSIASQYYNSVYPHSGDTKYNDYYSYYNWTYEFDLEEDTFDKGSPGEFYDNMNCCALWDIFDNNPDNVDFSEEVSDPNLTKIWSVLRGYKPEDMHDFWIGWFHHFGQNVDKDGIIDILQEHRMSFAQSGTLPQLPQNHAPVANAGKDKTVTQDRAEGALVHLNASGSSDSDGDALSYVWRYGYISYSGAQADIVLPVGQSIIELEVSDGKITTWDTVKVTVTPIK